MDCPFCTAEPARIVRALPTALVLRDAFPVSDGHLLVVPRRHIAGWDDATPDERAALMDGVDQARAFARAASATPIDGFNVGWNDGAAAGQTVMHLHLHVIPRRHGDVDDPRGGVRWVVPNRARYWEPT